MADDSTTAQEKRDSAIELVSAQTHQVLAYMAALEQQGYQPSSAEVEAYAEAPRRLTGRTTFPPWFDLAKLGVVGIGVRPVEDEKWVEYLRRLGWLTGPLGAAGRVRLAEAGRALLNHLNAQRAGLLADTPLVVNPDDPLAYAKVIGQIAQLEDALLVDQYVGADDVWVLSTGSSVRRILTSGKGRRGRLEELRAWLGTIAEERRPTVRLSNDLHDRFVVSPTRVLALGTSLNGVGRSLTVLTPFDGAVAAAIRTATQAMWDAAEPVVVERPSEPNSRPRRRSSSKVAPTSTS
jgi:hypothetical protein